MTPFHWDQAGDIALFDYDENNQLKSTNLANGIEQNFDYDDRGLEDTRTYKKATTTVYAMDSDYDQKGNVVKETVAALGQPNLVKDYSYDNLDRLLTEQRDTIAFSVWQYDQVGNWIFTDQNGFDENRTVNADNEYDTITGLIPVYDANGNMTSDGNKDYTYDWANRLIEVIEGGTTTVEYTYDALNRRVTTLTTGNSQLTTCIYDGGQVIEEYVGASLRTLERTYVYGAYIDDPIMVDYGGQRFYYVKDRQYSITAITDASGNIVERYEYTAFGLMTIFDSSNQDITATGSTIGNPYGFTGRRWDQETGLWYYRNRMYSPTLGRFMQRDPEGYVDGMNLYAYVKNNPLRFLDPWGLEVMEQDAQTYWTWESDSQGEESITQEPQQAVADQLRPQPQRPRHIAPEPQPVTRTAPQPEQTTSVVQQTSTPTSFWGTVKTVGSGIGQAGRGLVSALRNEDLQRGAIFGLTAAGEVTKYAFAVAAEDAFFAWLPIKGVNSETAKFIINRSVAVYRGQEAFFGSENDAKNLGGKIQRIYNNLN